MPKAVVFASGFGSNAEVIFKTCQSECYQIEILALVTDKLQSRAAHIAKLFDFEVIEYKPHHLETLISWLKKNHVDWIFLAGFMRLLPSHLIEHFPQKILNIHPSLLPAYPGLNVYERIYADQLTTSGVTIHFVDEGLDSGPIVLQQSFEILPSDTLEQIKSKGQAIEHQLYRQVLFQIATGDLK